MIKLFCYLALLLFWQSAYASEAIVIDKHDDPAYHTVEYIAHGEGCAIVWTVRHVKEPTIGFGFSESSKCNINLSEQKPYRSMLLARLLSDTNALEGVHGFGWGGLQRGDATDEYSKRLSAAMANSKHWNRAKGRPNNPKANAYQVVESVLKQGNVFSEIVEVFAAQHWRLEVRDIEALQIKNGLPFNCLVFFKLKPATAGQ